MSMLYDLIIAVENNDLEVSGSRPLSEDSLSSVTTLKFQMNAFPTAKETDDRGDSTQKMCPTGLKTLHRLMVHTPW